MARFWGVAVLLAIASCSRADQEPANACLVLPPAMRVSLTASPDGESLYWLERIRTYDFDAELKASWNLMRHDVRKRKTDVVLYDVLGPIHFIGNDVITTQGESAPRLIRPTGESQTQEITPHFLEILDVEVLDLHTIVFLAVGDGARAVYVLDLSEQRPSHLIDADILLSASGGRVFARVGEDVVIVDVKTRTTTTVPYIKKSQPQGSDLLHVAAGLVVMHDMVTSVSKPIVTTPRDWKLVFQGESTLARTPVKDERSFAYLLSGGTARALPTIVGGATILGATELGKQTWAMIGHNTSNYIGDLAETNMEVDICRLPASDEMAIPTRQIPGRFARKSQELRAAATAATSKDSTLQIFDYHGDPTTLFIDLHDEFGARDFDAMRQRVRDMYRGVTRLLTDREIRTEVRFTDRRSAVYRWRRDRGRPRTVVGMGDAMLSDPADFDFEIADLVNDKRDGKITCSGTLRNLTKRALPGVDVKCSGNRSHLIHLDKLGDDEARTFSQTFEVSDDGEGPYVEVMLDGRASEPRNADNEALSMSVFTLATDAYAASGLWLADHTVDADALTVNLNAENAILALEADKQQAAVEAAYNYYLGLRPIYGSESRKPVRLHVMVNLSETTFDFDGSHFERKD